MRSACAALLVTCALLGAAPAWAAPVGCGALGGVVEDGACHVVDSQPTYALNVEFPLDYPDEQAIVDYLSQTRAGFVTISQAIDARNLPYEMNVDAKSFRSAQTRSVVLTLFQDIGSAHPTTWYKSFTYDVNKGVPVTFGTAFDPAALQQIFPIVRRELETQTGLAGSISPGDGLDPSHYQNFAITDDSVIFFFGRAELLPSYAGATSVSIPRSEMPPLRL